MKKLIILCIICLVSLTCCKREKIISFEENNIDAMYPGDEWAVITEPYASYRCGAGYENKVLSNGRRGEVLSVIGKKFVKSSQNNNIVWYEFEKGWLEESVISVYSNKLKASYASKNLKK